MSGDSANAVLAVCAQELITRLFDAIGCEFGYLFSSKTNFRNLKSQVLQLENLREDVEIFLNEQSWNNTEKAKSSSGWLKEVEEMTLVAKAVGAKDNFGGWCVTLKNNRYVLSKKSAKLVAEIQKLRDQAPKNVAIHQARPAAMLRGAASNDASKDFNSRRKIMNQVMEALNDDKINIIGICGLGGVGKSTILHEVRERARAQTLFVEVAMTTVSQVINVFEIQKNLAGMLGLTDIDKVDDIIARADLLQKRLTNGSTILVILDDIWSAIRLEEVGIPIGNGWARCKVIIASRYESVCTTMGTQRTIPVDVFSKEEAWHMFKKAAGDCIEREKLVEVAKEVADECGGLPIALLTLARALFNKKKRAWEDARRQLRQSSVTRIPGMKKNVYSSIMLSYNFLTSELPEAQPLLLICCQHRDDDEIEVEKLARYCLALELFKKVDKLVDARNTTYTLIDHLRSCFLLQAVDVDVEGMYKKVKMHDVVRDVCLSIISEAKEERDKVYMHIMSQDSVGDHELGTNNEVDYPKLKLLRVPYYYNGGLHDIQRMEELRVLEIGGRRIKLGMGVWESRMSFFPRQLPLQVLKNLRMLCIEDQSLSEDIMTTIGSLSRLEILRFWGSKISSFPRQIGQLSNLKLLDLRSFKGKDKNVGSLIPSGILPQLNKLEVLCMGNFCLLGTGVDNDIKNGENYGSIIELDSLLDLTILQIDLVDPNNLLDLQCFRFENLETFLFTTKGKAFFDKSSLLVGKSIEFKDVAGMEWVKEAKIKFIIRSTLALRLENNNDLTDPLILKDFVSVEKVELTKCNQLEYIIAEGSLDKLQILKLKYMSNMRGLWTGAIDPLCLANLREILFFECEAIETIFPCTTAKCLVQLQKLEICWCGKLEGIFSKEELVTTCSSTAEIRKEPLINDFILLFPKLRVLHLRYLPELKGFYNVNIDDGKMLQPLINPRVILLPSLEKLTCDGLDHIKQIVGGGVDELSKLVASDWLQNLSVVEAYNCDSVETLFDFEGLHCMGERENAQFVTLGGLKSIYLNMLPKLQHLFWQIPHGIHSFQNLETLKVIECQSLGYLISSSMAHMLVNLKSLVVQRCESMKEVIKIDEDYDVKKILFRFLTSVTLEDLENLSSFCSNDRQSIELPSLEEVVIYKCPEMKTFCCGHLTAEKLQRVSQKSPYNDDYILVWKGDLNETVLHLNDNSDNEEGDDPERGGVADKYADECNSNEGTPMKASLPLSNVKSPNASLTPNVVSDNNESIANSSSPGLRIEASTEQNVDSSNDSPVQPKANKELSDMSLSKKDDSGSSSSIPLDWGMPEKDSMPLSIVSSPNVLLTPDNKEEFANSSTPNVRKVASMELSVHSSTDFRVQVPKADKELSDMSLSSQDCDWKRSRILIQGVYVKSEWKTTFEEILTATPNFLSGLRLKTAKLKTDVLELAIRSLHFLRQSADTISLEELACIKDSLDDLETIGLDTCWLERDYQRAMLVIKEKKAVSAAAELAMWERETTEDKVAFEMARAKLEVSTTRRDALKAEYGALMQELEAGKKLFGV